MNIMVSGSNGLIGKNLKQSLTKSGHEVISLSRDFSKPINFEGIDVVIHLAGENIAQKRWSPQQKDKIKNSRLIGTKQLSDQLASSEHKPSLFISSSATGFYGDRNDENLDENSNPGTGFLSDVCQEWENSTLSAEEAGIRTVHIRTGVVLSKDGGALKKMLPPFMFGAGGILGSGKQFMSWISIKDEIDAIIFIINNNSISGPVNLTAPNPVNNKQFTKILGKVIKRPTIAPLPGFIAKIMFGEMADAILLSGNKVYPKKLINAGYKFHHENLHEALTFVLKES